MKYFEKIMMHSEYDKGLIQNVQVVDDEGNFLESEAGDFVTITGLAVDDELTSLYGKEIKNYNGYEVTAPAALTDRVLVMDAAVVASLKDTGGNIYRVGNQVYGNKLPAGRMGRARVLDLHDTFWLGEENFATKPVVGEFAALTVEGLKLTPAATAAATGFVVKIEATKNKTTGADAGFPVYAVRVIQL